MGRSYPLSRVGKQREADRFGRRLPGYVADSLPSTSKGEAVSPVRIRPLGGAAGCLVMILVSVVASVVLTVLLNAVLR